MCPFAASLAVSGLISCNPPAPPLSSAPVSFFANLGPLRSPGPTAAYLCPWALGGEEQKKGHS